MLILSEGEYFQIVSVEDIRRRGMYWEILAKRHDTKQEVEGGKTRDKDA